MAESFLQLGDCLEALPTLEANCIDAVVTDPPYHLTQASRKGSPRKNDPKSPFGRHHIGEKGFMGKTWDGGDVAFRPETWAEILRVAKPGAHLLAFGGTRTFHRLMCAIEDAGWEIHDTIMWIYGSGMPKGKKLLKPAWEPIIVARKKGKSCLNIDACRIEPTGRWPANLVHDGSDEVLEHFPTTTSGKQAEGGHVRNSDKHRKVYAAFKGQRCKGDVLYGDTGSAARFFYCSKASKADRNSGLEKTEWLTLEWSQESEPKWESEGQKVQLLVDTEPSPPQVIVVSGALNNNVHEWSMLLFGNESTALSRLDTMYTTKTKTGSTINWATLNYFQNLLTNENTQVANSGMESGGNRVENVEDGTLFLNTTNARMESALGVANVASPTRLKISASEGGSRHPTVKPQALMRWLVRLATPPGGIVLDPFMGSGSTGVAALAEGFDFMGIDKDPEAYQIAEKRLTQACPS